jgi:hypothetical protein
MEWDELYTKGIDIEMISKDSEEYQTMFSAALHGSASAQYCLGLWTEKINKQPDVAIKWFRRAAQQNFEGAVESVQRCENKTGVTQAGGNVQENNNLAQSSSLIIREHNFQAAKNSLKKYTEQARQNVELSRVPYDGGLFNLGSHKVTGSELNRITSQIQDYLIKMNTLGQGLVDEFGEVYKAFEYLDKDYISGIVASIKAAEEVSIQEQKDRKDIKELVEQHDMSVMLLVEFKEDIEQLKHLTDVDKAWELIEEQANKTIEINEQFTDFRSVIESITTDIQNVKNNLEAQKKEISISRAELNRNISELNEVQEKKLNNIEHRYFDSIEKISIEQKLQLDSVENKLKNSLDSAVQEQVSEINKIENKQKENFEELLKSQSLTLEQIASEQSAKLAQIHQSLEEEKNNISEQVNVLTRKVKISYIVAGSATALTVIQFLLNILGVF